MTSRPTATRPVRETIEWVQLRWSNAPDTRLPRVLLVGDSIVVGYSDTVAAALKGEANVDMLATSAAIDDPVLTTLTRVAVEGYDPAVIHFNNGLHGEHVTDEAYRAGLEAYIRLLRRVAPQAQLVWASSTPITVSGNPAKLSPTKNAWVVRRNAIAAEVMHRHAIPIDDLYALVLDQSDLRAADGYHYNDRGRRLQGEAVARCVLGCLKGAGQRSP